MPSPASPPRPLCTFRTSPTWVTPISPSSAASTSEPWSPQNHSYCVLTQERLLRRCHLSAAGLFLITPCFSVPAKLESFVSLKQRFCFSVSGLLLIIEDSSAPVDLTPQILHSNGLVQSLKSETSQARPPPSVCTALDILIFQAH